MAGFTHRKRSPLAVAREHQKMSAILNISMDEVDKEVIMSRYREIVKAAHPDSSGACGGTYTLEEIRRAKDILIKKLEDEDV